MSSGSSNASSVSGVNSVSKTITKIKKASKLGPIEHIEYIEYIDSHDETNDQNIRYAKQGLLTHKDIQSAIKNYKSYPLYVIKYLFTLFPKTSCREAMDHIVRTSERRCDLVKCVLTSYSVKLCDIPDLDFDCNIVRAMKIVDRAANPSSSSEDDTNSDDSMQRLINVLHEIQETTDRDYCNCRDRRHWYELYDNFMNLIDQDERFMFDMYNVNQSITDLVAQTDVADETLSKILKKSVLNPKRWRTLLLFIKGTGLVSSAYGDMIFDIRDAILSNDNSDNPDPAIDKFNDRVLLTFLLKRYNEYHRNMSMITPNMYITDINGAGNTDLIRDKKIDCVVTLTRKSVFKASNVRYIHIEIDDVESTDFMSATLDYADEVIKLIDENNIILVHCYKGISRSVSFVVLVLVKQGMSYDDAMKLVKRKRPEANPNPAFKEQLRSYADSLM